MRAVLISAVNKTKSKPRRGGSINLTASLSIESRCWFLTYAVSEAEFAPPSPYPATFLLESRRSEKLLSVPRRIWQQRGATITTVYPSILPTTRPNQSIPDDIPDYNIVIL